MAGLYNTLGGTATHAVITMREWQQYFKRLFTIGVDIEPAQQFDMV